MTVALSTIQRTLLDQLKALNPLFLSEYGVKAILNDVPQEKSGYGLRLHTKTVNIDIVYMPSVDLYELRAYRLDGLGCEQVAHYPEVYCFELDERIRDVLSEGGV
jgi:hypothetical protein